MMGSMSQPDDPGKLFVGGIHPTTDEGSMRDYFSGFGEVIDCKLMIDNVTRKSRGFGFVTFKDPRSANDVVEKAPHVLDGKKIDPKKAVPKGPGQSMILKQMGMTPGTGVGGGAGGLGGPRGRGKNSEFKVFVGGISQATSENELRAYFSEYGNVMEVTIPLDRNTGNIRGFAFVGFDNADPVQRLLTIHFHQINGRTVEVKPCDEPSPKPRMDMNGQFMGSQAAAFGQDRSQAYGAQGGYGGYGSMMQQAAYAQAPGAAAGPYGAGYDILASSNPSTAYPDPSAYGQAASALSGYGAGYGAMSAAGTSQYGVAASTTALAGQNAAVAAAAGNPAAQGAATTGDYASFNQVYGFGNYQQEASSYGPSRTFASDLTGGYGSVATASQAAAYATATDVSAQYGVPVSYSDSSAAFGRGAVPAGNQRGFHPYGR